MTLNRNLLSEAVRYSLTAGAVGLLSLASAPAFAQATTGTTSTDSSQTKTLEKIEVTGSRIKRVEQEGPEPITILKRADLEVSGNLSIADVLRSSTFNSFGSFQQISGSSAQSQATVNLRGLGSKYTLILLDGRRIAGSPVLGASAQNLNSIPFAAVDRVEILRGSASAVYGSDAVGGVINIILRKDYQGLNVSASTEVSQLGEPSANSASITGGISSDRGNLTFVVDHQERSIFFNRDRATGGDIDPGVGFSSFGYPPSIRLFNSNDGTYSGGISVSRMPDPRCPSAFNTDPLFPNSGTFGGTTCYFNYAATNANEASLARESVLVNGNFDITDNISAFSRVIANQGSSFGRYAPTPITGPLLSIAGNNPNNPFGQDASLRFRFVPGGFRDATFKDHMFDVLFGFKGHNDWFGGADWEVAAHHNITEVQNTSKGNLLVPSLQQQVDAGAFNPFDDNFPTNVAAVGAAQFTTSEAASSRLEGFDANIGFDLFDIGDRSVGFVAGYDYERDYFADIFDPQTEAGNVAGGAGGSAAGNRTRYAVYTEAKFPVLANFNIDVAARYDSYSDFGNTANPSINFEYRPIDNLLLRASWGKGFRAPGLSELYSGQLQSFDPASDTRAIDAAGCAAFTDPTGTAHPAVAPTDTSDPLSAIILGVPVANGRYNPCVGTQYEDRQGGNRNLKAEKSRNWSVGAVWNAMDRLSFSLDYYNIQIKDKISIPGNQALFDAENASNGSPQVIRDPATGEPLLLLNVNKNFVSVKTAGWDFEGRYSFDTDWGTFSQELTWTRVAKFDQDGVDQLHHIFVPKDRAQLILGWAKGDFNAAIEGDLIGDSKTTDPNDGTFGEHIPTWVTWDVQAGWKTPWNGKVTMGVRNIAGKAPPLENIETLSPFYRNSQYNWLGRVPYLRYSQDF